MGERGGEFSFFQGIHVRIDIRSDIFISIAPMLSKLVIRLIYRSWLK